MFFFGCYSDSDDNEDEYIFPAKEVSVLYSYLTELVLILYILEYTWCSKITINLDKGMK